MEIRVITKSRVGICKKILIMLVTTTPNRAINKKVAQDDKSFFVVYPIRAKIPKVMEVTANTNIIDSKAKTTKIVEKVIPVINE